ncbi:MAG: CDP-alcohol phosphatidyltransferase family protein [Alphaproteobacteria bacterium]
MSVDKPHKRRQLRELPVRSLAPNILTVLALCAGLTAVRFALGDKFEFAALAILVAAVLDGLDGRVARLLKGETRFGAELDSLTDFVNFGIVPGMMLYLWSLQDAGGLGWVAVLAYCVCCGLRLARFNVGMDDIEDRPLWAANYFVGVPSPAGALIVMLPLALYFAGFTLIRDLHFLVVPYTFLAAFLFVSRIPTYSFKRLRVRRDLVLPILILVALLSAVLVTNPWETIAGITLIYMASLPFSALSFKKREEEEAAKANLEG